jgi:hypothetical protein
MRTDRAPTAWDDQLSRLVLALGRVARGPGRSLQAQGTLRIIQMAERLAARGRVKRAIRPGGLLQYEISPWHGRPLPLPEQPPVRSGEPIVLLHIPNAELAALANSLGDNRRMTWRGMHIIGGDIKALAALSATGALPASVRAVYAETLLYPMLARFGFTIRPAPRSLRAVFVRLYLLGLLALYSRDGMARLDGRQQEHLKLGDGWLALAELGRRRRAG